MLEENTEILELLFDNKTVTIDSAESEHLNVGLYNSILDSAQLFESALHNDFTKVHDEPLNPKANNTYIGGLDKIIDIDDGLEVLDSECTPFQLATIKVIENLCSQGDYHKAEVMASSANWSCEFYIVQPLFLALCAYAVAEVVTEELAYGLDGNNNFIESMRPVRLFSPKFYNYTTNTATFKIEVNTQDYLHHCLIHFNTDDKPIDIAMLKEYLEPDFMQSVCIEYINAVLDESIPDYSSVQHIIIEKYSNGTGALPAYKKHQVLFLIEKTIGAYVPNIAPTEEKS